VAKEPNPRQQLKIDIFEAYKNCKNIPLSEEEERKKQKGRFWVLIQRWCKKCLFIKNEKENETVDEMGEEILKIIEKMTNEDSTIKVFQELEEFIAYLNGALKNGMYQIIRDQLPEGVSKEKARKVFNIDKLIEIKQREREEELTEDERKEIISDYMTQSEYTEIKNRLNVLSTDYKFGSYEKDDKKDLLDFSNARNVFNTKTENKFGINPEELREALASVFASRQEKTRPFYKALFTAQCLEISDDTDKTGKIDNIKWLYGNFEWMQEYLDSDIIETFKKSNKIPTNKEIYMNLYPNPSKSPDQSASPLLRKFRDDLKKALENFH